MVDKGKFAEQEAALGYRLTVVGRNLYVTEPMKSYALDKLSKIDRFHHHTIDLHVTLDIQRLEHTCVVILSFDHFKVKVAASSTDMYASIDKAAHRLQSKIRRWKGKIQDHHKKKLSAVEMQISVLQSPFDPLVEMNEEIEKENGADEYRPPKVIGADTRPLKTLTTAEAMMKMELSDDHFMIFRGEEDRKLKVIYRRSDGNYGIILPE